MQEQETAEKTLWSREPEIRTARW